MLCYSLCYCFNNAIKTNTLNYAVPIPTVFDITSEYLITQLVQLIFAYCTTALSHPKDKLSALNRLIKRCLILRLGTPRIYQMPILRRLFYPCTFSIQYITTSRLHISSANQSIRDRMFSVFLINIELSYLSINHLTYLHTFYRRLPDALCL